MNSFALLFFAITKDDRVYHMTAQPGTTIEQLEDILEDFRKEFAIMKEEVNKPKEETPEPTLEVVS